MISQNGKIHLPEKSSSIKSFDRILKTYVEYHPVILKGKNRFVNKLSKLPKIREKLSKTRNLTAKRRNNWQFSRKVKNPAVFLIKQNKNLLGKTCAF